MFLIFYIFFLDPKAMLELLQNSVRSVTHLPKDFKTKVLSSHGVKCLLFKMHKLR